MPSPRNDCSALYHDNRMIIFGGRSSRSGAVVIPALISACIRGLHLPWRLSALPAMRPLCCFAVNCAARG